MLRRALLALVLCTCTGLAFGQDHPYRVVFDLTSKDSLDQRSVMRWIKEITSANPKAELEVVMYGKGFELVMPEKSFFLDDVKEAVRNSNVTFNVCQIALKNTKTDRNRLLREIHTVPDGIYEIVSKEREGWGYIKVGH